MVGNCPLRRFNTTLEQPVKNRLQHLGIPMATMQAFEAASGELRNLKRERLKATMPLTLCWQLVRGTLMKCCLAFFLEVAITKFGSMFDSVIDTLKEK